MKRILSLFVCIMVILALPASAATISLKDYQNGHINFDGDNKTVNITLSTEDNGVLYIYSGERSSLSDANIPIYASYIIGSDGDIVKNVRMSTITFGEYKVEFYSEDTDVEVASSSFIYYSPYSVLQNKRAAIVAELKAIPNPNGSSVEMVLSSDADKFSIISSDADMTDYNNVSNKTAMYGKMVSGIASLNDYWDMIDLFEKAAKNQYDEENEIPQSPSVLPGNNTASTVMTSSGNGGGGNVPTVTPPGQGFSDMNNHWAKTYSSRLKSLGIMNGYEDGTFRGDNPITRAELVKTLSETFDIPIAAGTKTYSDVLPGEWYTKYVLGAGESGIVNGYADGSFRPNQHIIRQDAALMIYRALSLKIAMSKSSINFADNLSISDYASEAVAALVNLKIITGDDKNCFNPLNELSRAELAALICRCIDCISMN